jgi:hypothetical protein
VTGTWSLTMTGLWLVALLGALPADPLAAGYSLFDAGDFEGALRAARDSAATMQAGPPRAALEVLEARCHLALRQELGVETALEAALTDDPALSVDASVSPAFAATIERLRLSLAGMVRVDTEPWGAGVLVDGVLVGKSPWSQRLPVGRHVVAWVDAQGRARELREVTVVPRRDQAVRFVDARAEGAVTLPSPSATAPSGSALAPAAVVHALVDVKSGAAWEAGAALLGRYWLVEADGIAGSVAGVAVHAGVRFGLWRELLGVQATADGVVFFSNPAAPGGGASAGLVVHPVSWLDAFVLGGASFLKPAPAFRAQYGLVDAGLRLRWPLAEGP